MNETLPFMPMLTQGKVIQYAHSSGVQIHEIPKVGFVSLGCPKALVDSERILTQLRLKVIRLHQIMMVLTSLL
jgi:hypothetical protein